ncbi:MAG: RIO1 family regulatory kinase/ATPase [Nanoarchaeota archaeon]|nr:RIO1 family regulatory kinase/ATPase [Nanoarchaeota archaeon]
MKPQILAQGAEAVISLVKQSSGGGRGLEGGQIIIKNRIKKSYRIKEIDEKLRKSRTKSEAKIINKLSQVIPVPKIIMTDNKQEIIMNYIKGKKLSDYLEKLDYKEICKTIAYNLGKMHDQGIIHGDLTTSNMIFVENPDLINKTDASLNQSLPQHLDLNIINTNKSARQSSKRRLSSINIQSSNSEIANSSEKVYFIDFGLAFHSNKIEDKAVDLHLLQQALKAKHFTIWEHCWKIILDNYKAKDAELIKKRIKVIESRGRYKEKY